MKVTISGTLRVEGAAAASVAALHKMASVVVRERVRRRNELQWLESTEDMSSVDAAGALILPRGMAANLRSAVSEPIEWVDATITALHDFATRAEQRPEQIAIAEIIGRRRQGIACAATGTGKTGAGFAAIARAGQRALVLTPTIALASQWSGEASRYLDAEPAVCAAGEWHDAPIIIATPQTAAAHPDKLRGFGIVVVDEVQGFATHTRRALIDSIPARYRLGLTATLPRDHRGEFLKRTIGPVLTTFDVAHGVGSGVILAPSFEQITTRFTAPYAGPADWQPLLDSIVKSEERNDLIVELVSRECPGVCTLVLSARLVHLDVLKRRFDARGLRAEILSGETAPAKRSEVLAAARQGLLDVVLGSVVADEGIDVPGLGALVLAFPSKAEGRLLQRIGRVVRNAPGKVRPRVFDLVDNVGPLRRQAQIRRAVFERAFSQAVAA